MNTSQKSNRVVCVLQTLEAQFRQQFSCPQSSPSQPSEGQQSTTRQKSPDGVAAYVLQLDGTMATVRYDKRASLLLYSLQVAGGAGGV